jgi:hypothetical protein
MASAELSRRVEKAVAYPPLSGMEAAQRRELHEALLARTASRTCPEDGRPPSCGPRRIGRESAAPVGP